MISDFNPILPRKKGGTLQIENIFEKLDKIIIFGLKLKHALYNLSLSQKCKILLKILLEISILVSYYDKTLITEFSPK